MAVTFTTRSQGWAKYKELVPKELRTLVWCKASMARLKVVIKAALDAQHAALPAFEQKDADDASDKMCRWIARVEASAPRSLQNATLVSPQPPPPQTFALEDVIAEHVSYLVEDGLPLPCVRSQVLAALQDNGIADLRAEQFITDAFHEHKAEDITQDEAWDLYVAQGLDAVLLQVEPAFHDQVRFYLQKRSEPGPTECPNTDDFDSTDTDTGSAVPRTEDKSPAQEDMELENECRVLAIQLAEQHGLSELQGVEGSRLLDTAATDTASRDCLLLETVRLQERDVRHHRQHGLGIARAGVIGDNSFATPADIANARSTIATRGPRNPDGSPNMQCDVVVQAIRAAVLVSSEEVDQAATCLNPLRGRTALDVLQENVDLGSGVAWATLDWYNDFYPAEQVKSRDLFIKARIRFQNGTFATILKSIDRLSPHLRGATKAELEGAIAQDIVLQQARQLYSQRHVESICALAVQVGQRRVHLQDIIMRGVSLQSRLLDSLNGLELPFREGRCVVDYVINCVARYKSDVNHRFIAGLDDRTIRSQFEQLGVDSEQGVSVVQLDEWIHRFDHQISYYALDPLTMEVFKYLDMGSRSLRLTFVVGRGHLYPITSEGMRRKIIINHTVRDDFSMGIRTDTDDFTFLSNTEDSIVRIVDEKNEGLIKHTVVYTDIELETLMSTISHVHKQMPDQIEIKCAHVEKFVHPVTLVIICRAEQWEARKSVCALLYEQYLCAEFHWRGQSWSRMGRVLAKLTSGEGQASSHVDTEAYDAYSAVPLVQVIVPTEEGPDTLAIDSTRCYTKAMYHNTAPWLIFSGLDEIRPYGNEPLDDHCEYYTRQADLKGSLKGVRLPAQIMCFEFVKWLTGNGYMSRAHISHYRRARRVHPAAMYMPFVEAADKLERAVGCTEHKVAKNLVNMFIGSLNIRDDSKDMVYMTVDMQEALSLYADHSERGHDVDIVSAEGANSTACILRLKQRTRRQQDKGPFWNQIIGTANMHVLQKAVQVLHNRNAVLVGIKTDCLLFTGVKACEIVLEGWKVEEFRMPISTWCPNRSLFCPVPPEPWETIDKSLLTLDTPCFVDGPGGAGKTYHVMELIKESTKQVLCLAYTNAAVANMKAKLDGAKNATLRTVCSALWTCKRQPGFLRNFDVLVIDEISMVGHREFMELVRLSPAVCICIGDFNQLPPVTNGVHYNLQESSTFRKWMGCTTVFMNFNPEYGRYDAETYAMLTEFLDTGRLPRCLRGKGIDRALEDNIVFTNSRRHAIVERLGGAPFSVGERVVAEYNSMADKKARSLKSAGLFNSSQYVVTRVGQNSYALQGVAGCIDAKYLVSAKAVTTHKYQGTECPRPFNIWEADLMGKELMYTALSRATKFSDIHIEFTHKKFHPAPYVSMVVQPQIPDAMHAWRADGKVSLLSTDDEKVAMGQLEVEAGQIEYVGRTYATEQWWAQRTQAMLNGDDFEQVCKKSSMNMTMNAYRVNVSSQAIRYSVNGKRYQKAFGKHTKKAKLEEAMGEMRDEVEKRWKSLGLWEWKKQPKNGAGQVFKMTLAEVREKPVEMGEQQEFKTVDDIQADMLVEKRTVDQYFNKRQWYLKKAKPVAEAIRKGTMTIRHGTYHMAECSRDELVVMIQRSMKLGKGELYEDLCHDTRLCADLDMETDEKWDTEQVALDVVAVACSVAQKKGAPMRLTDWRYQNATRKGKVSWHVICPDHVFEVLSDQLAFWMDVREELRSVHPQYFWKKLVKRSNGKQVEEERCIIDTAIYKSAQPMRCLYSEKKKKGNWLIPYTAYTDSARDVTTLVKVERDQMELRDIEQHLCSAPAPLCYSVLGVTLRNLPKSRAYKSRIAQPRASKPLSADLLAHLKDVPIPPGFSLRRAVECGESIRLNRTAEALCPCCDRTHSHDNAFLFRKNGEWHFKCFKVGCASVQLSRPAVDTVSRAEAKAMVADGCHVECRAGQYVVIDKGREFKVR